MSLVDEYNILQLILNFLGPYRDLVIAVFVLSISFIFGSSLEYVFGIFSLLNVMLYFLTNSLTFIYLSVGAVLLVLVIKIAHIYNTLA